MVTGFFEFHKGSTATDVSDNLFAMAIHDIEHDNAALSRLGIVKQKGTILVTRIIDGENLWLKHRGDMIPCWRRHESQLQKLVEMERKGIIVKTSANSFVCFFPEKSERLCHSVTEALTVAYKIQHELNVDDPIHIGGSEDSLCVKIAICYGPVYKRSVHVQKRTLADYCGGVMDEAHKALETSDDDLSIIVKSNYLDTSWLKMPPFKEKIGCPDVSAAFAC